MQIKSSLLGEQSIDPDTIISFPKGIPGFEDQTRFKLFHQEGDNPLIFWLQSLDNEALTLSVAQPSMFNINYSFILNDEEEAMLKIEDAADLLVLIILLKDTSSQSIIENMIRSLKTHILSLLGEASNQQPTIQGAIKSPLVINCAKRIGLQKALIQVEQSIMLTEVSP
jgi:flagellar assembly factor FliW